MSSCFVISSVLPLLPVWSLSKCQMNTSYSVLKGQTNEHTKRIIINTKHYYAETMACQAIMFHNLLQITSRTP